MAISPQDEARILAMIKAGKVPYRSSSSAPAPTIPTVGVGSSTPQFPGAAPGVPTNALSLGDVGGGLKSVGQWALKNPDAILALASLYQGYQENKRANQLTDEGIDSARARQATGKAAAEQLRGIQRPDLSDVYTDEGNPYARRRVPSVGARRY